MIEALQVLQQFPFNALQHRSGDQVIRENPFGRRTQRRRGTETSAEDLVGPPGRMVSERRATAVVHRKKSSVRMPHGDYKG